jgi:hypothetical protein
LADLVVLDKKNGRIWIAIAVVLDEDFPSFFVTVLVNQPSRALWYKWERDDAEYGRD